MNPPKVFVDSDVIISALLSQRGAASFLLKSQECDKCISDRSLQELEKVCSRLKINIKDLHDLTSGFMQTKLKQENIKHAEYVIDSGDEHIVAGAVQAQVTYLITYNLKHYKLENIKRDLGVLVITPGHFLQYL